jgi:TonB family protein
MNLASSIGSPQAAPSMGFVESGRLPALVAALCLQFLFVTFAAHALHRDRTILPESAYAPSPFTVSLIAETRPHGASLAARSGEALHMPDPLATTALPPMASLYRSASTLDIGPLPAGAPDFSSALSRPVFAGKVVLRVYVSSFGRPDRVEIIGAPNDPEFAQALRAAIERVSFLPGRKGGQDVAAYADFEFDPDVTGVTRIISASAS